MADWLLIRMPRAQDPQAQWLTVDALGQPLSSPQSGPLEAAAALAAGRNVAVLVPATELLQTAVELPPNAGSRLLQVVPFALEEQLAGDIEGQHFAVGARSGDGARVGVAAVDRALFKDWLDALQSAGLQPQLLCADSALLPENPGHVVALLEGDALYVRPHGSSAPPLTLPATHPAEALRIACANAPLQEQNVILYISPLDWQRHSSELEALRPLLATLNVQLLSSGLLPWFGTLLLNHGAINLLQGEFAPHTSWGAQWQRWRLAALLLGALLLVHAAGSALHLHQLTRSEAGFDSAIQDFAASNMPGDPGTGAVRARAEKLLLAAQGAAGRDAMLEILGALATATRGVDGTQLQTLSYRRDALELKLRTPNADSLEKINQSLQSQGWQSEVASGAAQGEAYEGRVQVKLKGRS
ncbi:MAG: type II secretion system protein GspL [Steroidobacteraceae bacterium]